MIVAKLTTSGGWYISELRAGCWVTRKYFGCGRKDAVARFRAEFESLASGD